MRSSMSSSDISHPEQMSNQSMAILTLAIEGKLLSEVLSFLFISPWLKVFFEKSSEARIAEVVFLKDLRCLRA
jgi:hypothetical protein